MLCCKDVTRYAVTSETYTSIAILSRTRYLLFARLAVLCVFILSDIRWRKIMGRPGARQAFGGSFWGPRLAPLPLLSFMAQAAS